MFYQRGIKKSHSGGDNIYMRDESLYLKDILQAMEAIEEFVKDMTFDDFEKDDKTSSAVMRKFEIIGEAAKKISDNIKNKYPKLPWKKMAGTRDVLIHFYFGVNYKIVWKTLKKIGPMKKIVKEILKDLGETI